MTRICLPGQRASRTRGRRSLLLNLVIVLILVDPSRFKFLIKIESICTQPKMNVPWFNWKVSMHTVKVFSCFTVRRMHHHTINCIIWLVPCHVLNSLWWHEQPLQSRCNWEVSKFFICHESLSHVSFGFVMGMPICYALGQLNIFKVVQHTEVKAHVNFLVS